jgi:hypothetical protein
MKTTQVEFLKSLSSAETMEAFIKSERIKRIAELGNGAQSTESKSLRSLLIKQLTDSPEARGFVGGFYQATLDAFACSNNDMELRVSLVSLITQLFTIGFQYAASLSDSSAESMVN